MNLFFSSKACRGFTLIEIILVVVLLLIIAALAIPNFSHTYTTVELQTSTQDLAYLMRYAQSRAISKNKNVQLEFNPEFTQYWLTQEKLDQDDSADQEEFERFDGRLGKTYEIPRDILLEDAPQTIRFYPDGNIEKKHFYVCQPAFCYTISTQDQKGFVDVFEEKVEY